MKTHKDFIVEEIYNELNVLCSTFDTRMLATAMLLKSTQMLRALHSTGMWRTEDIKAVVEGALENIYEQLPKDQVPRVATIGTPSSH